MFGSVLLLIAMLGPMVLLATILYYRYPDTAVSPMNQYIPPAISAISAWALCTSWLWFLPIQPLFESTCFPFGIGVAHLRNS